MLDLDDSFAASKPNQCEVFSKHWPKTIRKRPILYYRGSILFCLPCIANIGNDKWTNDLILVPSPIKVNHCALCQSECIEFQRKGIPFSSLSILSELRWSTHASTNLNGFTKALDIQCRRVFQHDRRHLLNHFTPGLQTV